MPRATRGRAVAAAFRDGASPRLAGRSQPAMRRQGNDWARMLPVPPDSVRPVVALYPLQAYDPETTKAGFGFPLESLVPLGEPYHYRCRFPDSFASGYSEFCGLSDGFYLNVADVTLNQPVASAISMPDTLRIRIALDGNGEYLPDQGEVLDYQGRTAGVVLEPAGASPAECISTGPMIAANIIVHREMLRSLYPQEDALPAVVRAFLAGRLDHRVARQLTCGPALLRCLEDLRNCALTGRNRWLFFRSKAVETLCLVFEALGKEGNLLPAEPSALVERAIVKAKTALMEQFVAPPSLDDLARTVGLSRTGLCLNFSRITGQTVFDFIADLRMQHALAMLDRRDLSITEIAYAVGYQYPSSFSVAVQRRFGMSPSELRRRN